MSPGFQGPAPISQHRAPVCLKTSRKYARASYQALELGFQLHGHSEDDRYAYLEDNGLLEGKTYPDRGVGLGSLVDASGNEIWSATAAMHRRDDE